MYLADHYDGAILDIMMPKMDGITVLKNIRAQGKLDVLFERFYRLDSSRNSGTGGSGIGLSVAQAIVQAHKVRLPQKQNRKRTDDHSSFIIESDYVIQPPDEGKKVSFIWRYFCSVMIEILVQNIVKQIE